MNYILKNKIAAICLAVVFLIMSAFVLYVKQDTEEYVWDPSIIDTEITRSLDSGIQLIQTDIPNEFPFKNNFKNLILNKSLVSAYDIRNMSDDGEVTYQVDVADVDENKILAHSNPDAFVYSKKTMKLGIDKTASSTDDEVQAALSVVENNKKDAWGNDVRLAYLNSLTHGEVIIGDNAWQFVDTIDYYDGGIHRTYFFKKDNYMFYFGSTDTSFVDSEITGYNGDDSWKFNVISSLKL